MPGALSSVPGFSEQQVHDLINIVHSVIQQYLAPRNQPSSNHDQAPSTPPAPQEAQKEENIQLLQQATMDDITESTTESTTKQDSSMPNSKSTLSTIPRLCIVRSSGDSAACLSHTLLLACLLGYIEHSEGIETTGQGWWERAGFIGSYYQHGCKPETRTKATVCISAIRPWGHGHFCFLWAFIRDSFPRHPY